MTRRNDDHLKLSSFDKEDTGGGRDDLPIRHKRIADPRIRRLVLAKIDALLSARAKAE